MRENFFFKYLNHPGLALISVAMLLMGLLVSKVMLSIGMILLAAHTIIHPEVKRHFEAFWKRKDFVAITSIFFLYLITGLWSENMDFFIDRMRMKLPFLLMPFVILSLKDFNRKRFDSFMLFFFWLVTAFSMASLIQYGIDYESITENYDKGQVMPTPIQHIRFSLIVVWTICLGIYFIEKSYFLKDKRATMLTILATIFLVTYVHILAVRSGLLAFYVVVLFYILHYIFKKKRFLSSLIVIAAMILAGWFSYQYFPTLERKVNYTFYSLELFEKNENIRDLSDSRRLGSILAGIDIGRENMLHGVGIGDIKDEINENLKANYPELIDLGLMPHNQYIFVFTFAGLFGLLWFVFATIFPLFYKQAWKSALFIALNLIYFSSFMVEHTIETQIGSAFYVLFLLLMMKVLTTEAGNKVA